MITAIQELIEFFNERPEYDKTSEGYEIIKKATHLLEKEKEQMINFANCFYDDCVTEGGSLKQSAEEYYNQTYNQNET